MVLGKTRDSQGWFLPFSQMNNQKNQNQQDRFLKLEKKGKRGLQTVLLYREQTFGRVFGVKRFLQVFHQHPHLQRIPAYVRCLLEVQV